jgi:Galactose oxidase, central domain
MAIDKKDITVRLTPESHTVTARGSKNRVVIQVQITSATEDKLYVSVLVPFGNSEGKSFLLREEDPPPMLIAEYESESIGNRTERQKVQYRWGVNGVTISPGTTLTLSFDNFIADTNEGPAEINVQTKLGGGKPIDFPFTIQVVSLHPSLEFFRVDPGYLEKPGEVTVSGRATGVIQLAVYCNDFLLRNLSAEGSDVVPFSFQHKVTGTSTYRLEVSKPESMAQTGGFPYERTVHVLKDGWSFKASSELGYPTQFMMLPGATSRIYGVFARKTDADRGDARLWSSADGWGKWEEISSVPWGMCHSPGVAWKGKLWLMGGSSVDTRDQDFSNEVWSFDPATSARWIKVEPAPDWKERMGHACVVFDDKIWILGGIGRDRVALNDVWSSTSEGVWHKELEHAPWSPRCMFAAAATLQHSGKWFGRPRLWVYGGVDHPFHLDVSAGLWSSTDGVAWEDFSEILPRNLGDPMGATLLDDGKSIQLDGEFWKDGDLKGESRSRVFSQALNDWQLQPHSWNWDFSSDVFLMRSLALRQLRLVWGLHRGIGPGQFPRYHIWNGAE